MIRKALLFPLALLVCAFAQTFAQAQTAPVAEQLPTTAHAAQVAVPVSQPVAAVLSMKAVGTHIAEAETLLKAHAAANSLPTDFVTLAALDKVDSRIHLLSLSKEFFLRRGAETFVTTSHGEAARAVVLRANGVNTAVQVFHTATGRQLVPLVVQYPIVRSGRLSEMAYYTSAHPALLSPEVVTVGGAYVRTMLDDAAARLRAQGVQIEPEIVDIAERLCIVEHTDHKRFMTENRAALFREILSLYALNEPDTYRYSVSTAGAGGMVQMIPSTYAMVRRLHPNITLKEDFVGGMTDHANALTAMLLYMQDTWNDLLRREEVRDALNTGLATQPELVAAGYNSNPARLPSYIKRGGAGWRYLIPTETQMYLRIYASLDELHFQNRHAPKRTRPVTHDMPALLASLLNVRQPTRLTLGAPILKGLLTALGDGLLTGGGL